MTGTEPRTTGSESPAGTEPPTRAPLTWAQVQVALHEQDRAAGDPAPILALFAGRTEAERRKLLPQYKEAVRSLRDTSRGLRSLRYVGIACLGGPAGIAQWLSREDMTRPTTTDVDERAVHTLLAERNPAWTAEIVRRLAAKMPVDPWDNQWAVADALVRGSGLPTPTTTGFVVRWVAKVGQESTGAAGRTLTERLREDPYFTDLLPALFEVAGVGAHLENHESLKQAGSPGWGAALAELADAKVIERDIVLDGCLSRLLRGERPNALRAFVRMHDAMAPTDDELAARVDSYLRLLPDAPSPVAGTAQEVLRRLDAAGRLDAERLAEASRSVLFRSEKKLVRSQLVWLAQSIERHPDHAGTLLACACTVFGSTAVDLQERALTLIAKRVGPLAPDQAALVHDEVRARLPLLGEALRPEAAALIGESVAAEPDPAPPLAPPPPRELPPPIASPAELVEELAVLFARTANPWVDPRGRATDPLAVERIVSAMLREHARDREALHTALLPLTERHGHIIHQHWFIHQVQGAVGAMVAAATGYGGSRSGWFRSLFGKGTEASDHELIPGAKVDVERLEPAQRFLLARLYEVGTRLRLPRSGPYLAEIADATGFVDPHALVAGLEQWEASGHTPWRRDVDQALLRLPADVDPVVAARAGRLTSPAGLRVAAVLAAGGPPAAVVGRRRFDRIHREFSNRDRGWVHFDGPLASVAPGDRELLPKSALILYDLADPGAAARGGGRSENTEPDLHCWPLVLPRDRDALAAHVAIRTQRAIDGSCRGAEILPALAESHGPLGPGMSLALAYALGARTAEDRAAAVDAVVTLAARGDAWDTAALGRDIGEAVRTRGLKTTRVVTSLQDAARAGAGRAVWGVMSGLLPDLLAGTKHTGLADALAVAAETAASGGGRAGSIPGLDALADRKGSSRAVGEAKRLRRLLADRG
ncbi:DUF6493 family protein [Embleya scabrispora]|uniref:DUF6493 family protein n=1 Tax=Embleya scabrispora TaxID=159449 RepID=UPI000382C103|nr:DUF6493 family protein [Embleya scabrispora]MYS82266.1 hypothetical protein [Streptomyces sp. SID5474]